MYMKSFELYVTLPANIQYINLSDMTLGNIQLHWQHVIINDNQEFVSMEKSFSWFFMVTGYDVNALRTNRKQYKSKHVHIPLAIL